MIATLGETTGYPGLLWMKKKMASDDVGRLILKLAQLHSYYTSPIMLLYRNTSAFCPSSWTLYSLSLTPSIVRPMLPCCVYCQAISASKYLY